MLIEQTIYPEFVADQILSSEHLNRLFGYLEEQERLTRANLIGIGIVCGLEVKINGNATALTITKGSGVTSKGYLVSMPETVYYGYKTYDVRKNHAYDLFVPDVNDVTRDIPVHELTTAPTGDGVQQLSTSFLTDRVVMMFVELRAQTIEDCDTNDCDDDGVMVTVNLRPLLIHKSYVDAVSPVGSYAGADLSMLPELALRRFDVTATTLDGTASIISGYWKIIANQMEALRNALTATYSSMYPFVFDEYPVNPFTDLLNERFSFVINNEYPVNDVLQIQYYYDLLADLYSAYNMIRENADHLISVCNADGNLFPRHLMLGPASNAAVDGSRVLYRNYFMPSGAMQSCCGEVGELRLEFKRLTLLLQTYDLPIKFSGNVEIGQGEIPATPIRITPTVKGNVSLSQKSIPFYYDVASGTDKLYRYWNYAKTHAGQADRNLSYHASDYRSGPADDPILQPLYYDLEEYNAFIVEGQVGMGYREAMNTILLLRNQYRLPIDVVAIRTSHPAASDLKKLCCGDGLELSYDIVSREWEAVIGETIEYINANRTAINQFFSQEGQQAQLQTYLAKLAEAKTYTVRDMSAFMQKYDTFMDNIYEKVEDQTKTLRTIVYDQLVGEVDTIVGEDLVDHFDAVIQGGMKGPYRALKQAFDGLTLSIEDTLTLSEYTKMHPGLQHGSVPKGGTLVLIYHTVDPEDNGEQDELDEMIEQLAEGTVVADFFLPYLCCADCSPVQVSIGNGQPPVEKPEISLQGNITRICQGDPNTPPKYEINVSPIEAAVTADVAGTITYDSTVQKWYFLPNALTIPTSSTSGTVTLTAENGGQTSSVTLTLYAMPVLSFSTSQAGNTVTVTNTSTHLAATGVTWSFGDGAGTTDYSPLPHTYPTASSDKTYVITMSAATNGTCVPKAATKMITISSSLPCGGNRQTCDYKWTYPQNEFQSLQLETGRQIDIYVAVNGYYVSNQQIVTNRQVFAPLHLNNAQFTTVWPAIADMLNARYQGYNLAVNFIRTAAEGQEFRISIDSYPCLDFYFDFEVWAMWGSNTSTRHLYTIGNTNIIERDLKGNVLSNTAPFNCRPTTADR